MICEQINVRCEWPTVTWQFVLEDCICIDIDHCIGVLELGWLNRTHRQLVVPFQWNRIYSHSISLVEHCTATKSLKCHTETLNNMHINHPWEYERGVLSTKNSIRWVLSTNPYILGLGLGQLTPTPVWGIVLYKSNSV